MAGTGAYGWYLVTCRFGLIFNSMLNSFDTEDPLIFLLLLQLNICNVGDKNNLSDKMKKVHVSSGGSGRVALCGLQGG